METEFPKGDFRTVLYRDNSSTAQVLLYAPGTYFIAQLNPYTGDLIHLQDMNKGWLNQIKLLHRNLMLGGIGREIVHWITLLFLLMLVSGIIIWWPRKKRERKQRMTFKWRASPTKLNYDLHNVLGFYATWIAIFSVITGLFWGFEIVRDTLISATGENEIVYKTPQSGENSLPKIHNQLAVIDSIALSTMKKHPSKSINISYPHEANDPISVVVSDPGLDVTKVDNFYFDRYTGERIKGRFKSGMSAEASLYLRINGLVYDLHFGNILGISGRLLVFFSSLIAASLPITGFAVWLSRRKCK